ncbi:MAG: aspartate/glutamate racemase family protein [Paracoccaceae bacterium]|nr:aspartate/glutamate racemase family protein [Paracoccaceae bacterium]
MTKAWANELSPAAALKIPDLRIGMLVPSSNTALEPATAALTFPVSDRVGVHFSRFEVTRIALDHQADAQFSMEPILKAARLLADAKVSVIAWNGTSASWRGFDTDDALCREIEQSTGCPATSAIVGLNSALRAFGTRRLGLVTPYTEDVEAAIIANYATIGIDIVAARRENLQDNYSFADVPPDRVAEMCREVAAQGVDAVAIVCTNMRGPLIAPQIEAEFGIPVIDSIAVTLWGTLNMLGIDYSVLAPFGQLFKVTSDDPERL